MNNVQQRVQEAIDRLVESGAEEGLQVACMVRKLRLTPFRVSTVRPQRPRAVLGTPDATSTLLCSSLFLHLFYPSCLISSLSPLSLIMRRTWNCSCCANNFESCSGNRPADYA